MLSKLKNKQKGFTIIEVMIVLAIAGLILLIVFLAVPALQRNARNTQRSNDVASYLAAINEYVNNNNGTMPTTASVDTSGNLTVSGGSGTNASTAKLGYYKSGVSISTSAPGSAGANSTDVNSMTAYMGAACNSANTMAVSGSSVPSRSIAVVYTLENNVLQCKAS